MNSQLASKLSKEMGISLDLVVREEYEMIILKKLFESELGLSFVFKGGTALRLAYGSKRFSEDLDFAVTKKVDLNLLRKVFVDLTRDFDNLELFEVVAKRFTVFAIFKVKEDFLVQNFSIKFEASTRPQKLVRSKGYELITLSSKISPITVLAQVEGLEQILKEKESIIPARVRDVYDIWFIKQVLGIRLPLDFKGFDKKDIKRDLNKFLNLNDRKLIESWV